MDLSEFTFADLHAIKGQAKEKESYYRAIKYLNPEFGTLADHYKSIKEAADKELTNRLNTFYVRS